MSRWNAMRYGINVKMKSLLGIPYRAQVRRAWSMDTDVFWRYQRDRFLEIYDYARFNIPYYKERIHLYPAIGERGRDVHEILRALPILRKEEVRRYNGNFWPDPRPRFLKFHQTSGTSGTQLTLAMNLREKGMQQAIFDEWKRRITGMSSLRTLNLVGAMAPSAQRRELYWMDRATGQVFLSIYSLNKKNRDAVIDLFQRFQPRYIYGYASAIYQLSLLLGEDVLSGREERVAVSTAEMIYPNWIKVIETNLVRKVYDFYSSQEGCHGVMACEAGKMHIHPLFGILEIVDEEGNQVGEGEVGRVLVTGLLRKSMPLIRYDIGDRVISTGFNAECSCGLHWPTIGAVDGRESDYLLTRDGRRLPQMSKAITVAIGEMKGVKEFQLVQRDFESFSLYIVEAEDSKVDHQVLEWKVEAELKKRIQTDHFRVEYLYVGEIARGPNGKFKIFANVMNH